VWLSRENAWYDVNGNALYVRKGEKFPDDDPAVKAMPQIFDKLSDDVPPGGVKAAVAKAKAAATGVAAGKPAAAASAGKSSDG
jgi:hypothetical protein